MFKKSHILHNKIINIYKNQCNILTEDQKKSMKVQDMTQNLTIDLHLDDLPPMPPLEGEEETIA